ncbi:MAG: RtcB family protein, partial [Bacillota bacterium]|nr:RtcB family protein [Bacillota bacterium]
RPGHGAAPRPTEGLEAIQRWLREKVIMLRGGDGDEAPQVHLEEVLAEQKRTVEGVERLRPLMALMAGPEIFDPYQD